MPRLSHQVLACLTILLWCSHPLAQEGVATQGTTPAIVNNEATSEVAPVEVEAEPITVMARLTLLREQLLSSRQEMEALRKELSHTRSEERIAHIKQRLEELPKSIEALNRSFEQIALGGIDMKAFSEQPEVKFDWKDELIEITRPLFGSLKDLTEKPRKIEQLRQQIDHLQQQLEVVQRALASLDALRQDAPPPSVESRLANLAESWQQRQKDLNAELEMAHYQIATLQGEARSSWEAIVQSLLTFFKGRGLTLLIALVAVMAVWQLTHLLLLLGRRTAAAPGHQQSRRRRTRERAIGYLYRVVMTILMLIVLLTVFYARNDLVLLALTVVVLVMVGLTLRQTLPRYIKEIRTLLDFGSVREGERIVYNGLPLEVSSINAFTILRNPELEGIIRLPLTAMVDLVSRPAPSEEWLPCSIGDFLMFPDGRIAEVLRLTLERVELRMMRSMVQYPTADFLAMEYRNLSRSGFAVPTTFGIDYRHQAICLDEIPQKFHAAVEQAIKESPFAPSFVELLVEFKEAGASSLDYLIYLSMRGEAAASYYTLGRLVQRTLVEVCNREEWVIPFAQLTVHQGEGFDSLRTAP
jgi:small-conductance mechanosensitive channel